MLIGRKAIKLYALVGTWNFLIIRIKSHLMKKNIFATCCLLFAACYCLSSCKKTGASDDTEPVSALTYQYRGQDYTGDDGNWGLITDGTEATGISINRADLFGGELILKRVVVPMLTLILN
jgi:hypothetical protein